MSSGNGSVWRHCIRRNAEIAENCLKNVQLACELFDNTIDSKNDVRRLAGKTEQDLLSYIFLIDKALANMQRAQTNLIEMRKQMTDKDLRE